MSLRTYLTPICMLLKPQQTCRLRILGRTQISRFSGSTIVREHDHKSYSVDEMSQFLESKSPEQSFKLSIRQPSEVSKQGDTAVGYEVTVEAIRYSLKEIEDTHSDRFLIEGPNEIVYMTKASVKPKFEVALQRLTNQKSKAGMEPKMEWGAEDGKVNETTTKRGSQPIS
ncbi:hypothetical protein K7432_011996 [Basidiobolus ranarum]|uniref:Uncharacterized protein n=1 Tax=Basidiobolus ranarum TaxID=34480 RepID=A0ABR2VT02_9FUNG